MNGFIGNNISSTKDQARSDLEAELISIFIEFREDLSPALKDVLDRHRSILYGVYVDCLEHDGLIDYHALLLELAHSPQEFEVKVIYNFISEFHWARISRNIYAKKSKKIDPANIFHSETVQ